MFQQFKIKKILKIDFAKKDLKDFLNNPVYNNKRMHSLLLTFFLTSIAMM